MIAKLERTQSNEYQNKQWEVHKTIDQQQKNHRLRTDGNRVLNTCNMHFSICQWAPLSVTIFITHVRILRNGSYANAKCTS